MVKILVINQLYSTTTEKVMFSTILLQLSRKANDAE